MAFKALPPIDHLRQLLRYEPDTGKLFWLERGPQWFTEGRHAASHRCKCWNARYAGAEALTAVGRGGHKHGTVLDVHYFAHRLIWALHFGEYPKDEIDHINGNAADNRICNLRVVSHAENMRNTKRQKSNSSGVMGVCWVRAEGKWSARIKVHGQTLHLGRHASFEAAVTARKNAEITHSYHPNHGAR